MTREHLMCVFDINPKVAMIQYKDGRWKTIKTVVDHHGVHRLVLIAIFLIYFVSNGLNLAYIGINN